MKSNPKAPNNPYTHRRAFARLSSLDQKQVIVAGTLAWYADLFAFPAGWRGRLRELPYYEVAEHTYYILPFSRATATRAFQRRLWSALKRGNLPRALEYYFAFRRPDLTLLTTRPVYRWLGGNKRPVIATLGAFLYTAFVVHPMILVVGLFAFCGWMAAPHQSPMERLVSSLRFGAIPLAAGMVWVGIGGLVAFSKGWRAIKQVSTCCEPACGVTSL